MKLLVSVKNKKDIDSLIEKGIDSFLVGVKDFSLYQSVYFDIEEIEELVNNYSNINFFISINKLIHNDDLEKLKEILISLEKIPHKGILYDDYAILNLNKKNKLIWAGNHFVTSYHTINSFENIEGAFISSEITLKEILEIRKNTEKILIVSGFGYQPMTTSRRTLLSNYLREIKANINTKKHYLTDDKHKYTIIEDNLGTHIYTGEVLDAISEVNNLEREKIDYLYLNGINIEDDKYIEVIKRYQKALLKEEVNIEDLIPNRSDLFLYKESFFKVGDNDVK